MRSVHPFLSLGVSDLPMSESHVIAVIPSVANSFKLAVPDSMVGTMTQDRATGVLGKLGQAAEDDPRADGGHDEPRTERHRQL
jgi:hypothetical protein